MFLVLWAITKMPGGNKQLAGISQTQGSMKSVSVSVSVRKLPVPSTTGLPSLGYLYVHEMSMGGRSIRNYVCIATRYLVILSVW